MKLVGVAEDISDLKLSSTLPSEPREIGFNGLNRDE